MALFKVIPQNRSRKVAIKASTTKELIERAIVKLDLVEQIYQIVLADDGTEIDEDDILLDIAKTSQSPVLLMLIPQGSTWQDPSCIQITDVPKTTQARNPIGDASSSISTYTPDVVPFGSAASLWQRFPLRLLKSCEADEPVRSDDRRVMVVAIANYMLQDLKDSSRKTAERIARMIFEKYPKSFGDTIDNEIIGAGMESLRAQIYTAVHYRKDITKKIPAEDNSDQSDSETSSMSSVSRKQDEYGCMEYQPFLSVTETHSTQEEKRLKLLEYYSSHQADDDQIIKLMEETYVSQRLAINKSHRDLEQIFQDWPFFKNSNTLIRHASRLLGKEVQVTWNDSLTTKAEPIRKYFKSAEMAKEHKNRKSTKHVAAVDNENNASPKYILDLLSDAKQQARCVTRSQVPEIAVVFPLIVHFMKEDLDHLFIVVDEDLSIEAVAAKIPSMCPTLVIRGKGLYDESATTKVFLEQKIAIDVAGLLEGLLLTFLAYYIFGYSYPPKLCRTLEFIQRVFLHINPPKGDKRDNKRRRTLSFDPKVLKLTNELNNFTHQF